MYNRGIPLNVRIIPVVFYVIAFLIGLGAFVSIPSLSWTLLNDWQKTLIGVAFLVAFCGILVAYWVYNDYEELTFEVERIDQRIDYVEDQIRELKIPGKTDKASSESSKESTASDS